MDTYSGKKQARRYGEHYFVRESVDKDWKKVTREEHSVHRKLDEQGNKLRTMYTLSQRQKPGYIPLDKTSVTRPEHDAHRKDEDNTLGTSETQSQREKPGYQPSGKPWIPLTNPTKLPRRHGEHYFIRESVNKDWKKVHRAVHDVHRKLDEQGNKLRTMHTLSQREKPGYIPLIKSTTPPTNPVNDNRERDSRSEQGVDRSYSERSRNDRSRSRDRRDLISSQRNRERSPEQSSRYNDQAERNSEACRRRRSPERPTYNDGYSEPRRDSDNYRPQRRRSRSPQYSRYNDRSRAWSPDTNRRSSGTSMVHYRERRSPDRCSRDYYGEFNRP